MQKNTLLIIVFIIAVLAVAAGAYYYGNKTGYEKGYGDGDVAGRAAAKVEAGTAVSNPMEKMPETNPFKGVVNPFEAGYKNPFE